jgi:hypothetical protein
MDVAFQQYIEELHPSFERLLNQTPVTITNLPKELPRQCVYLFSEGEHHLLEGQITSVTVFASTLSMARNTIRLCSRLDWPASRWGRQKQVIRLRALEPPSQPTLNSLGHFCRPSDA